MGSLTLILSIALYILRGCNNIITCVHRACSWLVLLQGNYSLLTSLIYTMFCMPFKMTKTFYVTRNFFKYYKGTLAIGIVEKVQETSLYTGMHNRAITVLTVNVTWKAEKHPELIII